MSLSSSSFRSNNFTDASGILTYTSLVRTSVLVSIRGTVSVLDFWSIPFKAFVEGILIPATYPGIAMVFCSLIILFVSQEFDLSSGESFEVEFVGKRVAFR